MSHHSENSDHLSPQEIKFNDLIKRGDDLFNISIYRYAKDWYLRALELHVNDKLINQKLSEIASKQKSTTTKVIIILAIAVVIVGIVWVYKY